MYTYTQTHIHTHKYTSVLTEYAILVKLIRLPVFVEIIFPILLLRSIEFSNF